MIAAFAILAIWVACAVAVAIVVTRGREPAGPNLDPCEECGVPSTHELAAVTHERDGGSAMIACYCRRHAPRGAVKVR